jgi:hypothetical protein
MKWVNKGHEFDELGATLQKLNAIYLFGAGMNGKTAYKKYCDKINIRGFIDNDPDKQGGNLCRLEVLAPAAVKPADDEAIVISAQPSLIGVMTEQMRNMGYEGNVFPMQTFFPVLDMYKFMEVCLTSVSFLPTTACNLKCKHCLNFSPFIERHITRPIEQLKLDLDFLFSRIDTLLLLHISGGEPFIYPRLPELIDYIVQNFNSKLGLLEMTTNGTIIPSERLFKAMRDGNVYLTVDDYNDAVPLYREKHGKLLEKLNTYGISYRILKANSWIDLAPPGTDNSLLSDEQLCDYFNACAVPWQEYRDGKLWLCNYAAYADVAGKQEAQSNDYFDLAGLTADNKYELVEFRLGYSEKGYARFCRHCLGYNTNPKTVPVAEQL